MALTGGDILLVGNGPSLLAKRLGPKIDEFSDVARFNSFELNGFEEQVGTRTTIWSRWYGLPTMRPMEDLSSIWLNMPVHERTEPKLAKALDLVRNFAAKVQVIPALDVAAELQRELFGGPSTSKWPSSGLLAIAHAISVGRNVTIVGFDSWATEPFHYYGHHDRTGTHHVAELERAHIARLVRDGTVRKLEECG